GVGRAALRDRRLQPARTGAAGRDRAEQPEPGRRRARGPEADRRDRERGGHLDRQPPHPAVPVSRRAFSIAEAVVAVALGAALIGLLVWLLVFGGSANQRLGQDLGLQQQSRKAVVRLLQELQE